VDGVWPSDRPAARRRPPINIRDHPPPSPAPLAASRPGQVAPALGGRRRPDPDSPNDAWRHPAFRGYADYVASEEFAEGLFELLMMAEGLRTVIMCAEVLWWRCHRRIISDVLVSIGAEVVHIRDARTAEPHRLAPPARVVRGRLTYAGTP